VRYAAAIPPYPSLSPLPLPLLLFLPSPPPQREKLAETFSVSLLYVPATRPPVCADLYALYCGILDSHLLMYYFTRQGRRGEQAVVERKGFGVPTFDSRPPAN